MNCMFQQRLAAWSCLGTFPPLAVAVTSSAAWSSATRVGHGDLPSPVVNQCACRADRAGTSTKDPHLPPLPVALCEYPSEAEVHKGHQSCSNRPAEELEVQRQLKEQENSQRNGKPMSD